MQPTPNSPVRTGLFGVADVLDSPLSMALGTP